MVSLSHTWGTSSEERHLSYPCDGLIAHPDLAVFRGVSINTPPAIVFRWLCQMRLAPYSYDWIDNGGRESPRELSPGLEHLEVGLDVMRIFELVDFERDRHLTIRVKSETRAARTFGDIAVSYLIVAGQNNCCRLLVKLIANFPSGIKGRIMRAFLPWGDLVMMRRQLLNFKQLAENSP
jgi:aryl carrier-like protein